MHTSSGTETSVQGLVLLEAMALGVPVISTAVMGTRDVDGPRRGALVPKDNEAGLRAQYREADGGRRAARTPRRRGASLCRRMERRHSGRLADAYQEVFRTNNAIFSEPGRQDTNAVSPEMVTR